LKTLLSYCKIGRVYPVRYPAMTRSLVNRMIASKLWKRYKNSPDAIEREGDVMAKTEMLNKGTATIQAQGFAAKNAKEPLAPFSFERRQVREHDVLIAIDYCGVCHSDIHQVRDEWGGSIFPMVPGHEIVGHVTEVGPGVTRFKVGDSVGVGCLVDSCRVCALLHQGQQPYL
jgi:hypothetical protein